MRECLAIGSAGQQVLGGQKECRGWVDWSQSEHAIGVYMSTSLFFFNDTATTEIYTLSLHDALPILPGCTKISSYQFVTECILIN